MDDQAWSLTGRGADALSTDPISVASFVHGQGVCATKFAAAVLVSSLRARRPADDPLFDELVMRMATACWHYRVDPEDVTRYLLENVGSRELTCRLALPRINPAADYLARCGRNPVDARNKITAEFEGFRIEMEARGTRELTEDVFEDIVHCDGIRRGDIRCDLLYVVAIQYGFGRAASELLPRAVWELRTEPIRERLFKQFIEEGRSK